MMTWLEVCKEVVGSGGGKEDTEAQTYYGRLLAVNGVCELVTSQLVGVASDKYGRRSVQIAAQLGQVVDYLMAALCLPPSFGYLPQVQRVMAWTGLFASRGVAGLLGNYKVTLQSYTSDISGAEECPQRMSYLGAAMVVGMCMGSMVVAIVEKMQLSFRACFLTATCMNAMIIVLVFVKWRDIAPRKNFTCRETNPFVGLHVLRINQAMVMYSTLVFLSAFSLNMYTSTLNFYCEKLLKMPKSTFIALGTMWAMESFILLGFVQPMLIRQFGEIGTLQLSFASMIAFYLLFSMLTPDINAWAFIIMILFAVGSMAYPLAVGLATRELSSDQQGLLQGAVSILETLAKIVAPLVASDVIIPRFNKPDQFFGMVYFVAGLLLLPSLACCHKLHSLTGRIDPDKAVMLEMQIGRAHV